MPAKGLKTLESSWFMDQMNIDTGLCISEVLVLAFGRARKGLLHQICLSLSYYYYYYYFFAVKCNFLRIVRVVLVFQNWLNRTISLKGLLEPHLKSSCPVLSFHTCWGVVSEWEWREWRSENLTWKNSDISCAFHLLKRCCIQSWCRRPWNRFMESWHLLWVCCLPKGPQSLACSLSWVVNL